MRRRAHKTQGLIAEINITPFTDVILVLLIIFMVATPLISQSTIEIKLPEATSKDTVDDPKPLYISITAEGVVYVENKVLTNKELTERIQTMLSQNENLRAIVAADRSCRFQEVVKVMDTLRELGVKSMNVVTKTDE